MKGTDMDFRNEILQALQRAIIHHLRLWGGEVFLSNRPYDVGGSLWGRRLIEELLDSELIRLEELRNAVSEGIVLYGVQLYDQVRDGRVMPDHVVSPEALAYALRSGRIPPKDARRIKFDHGESLESFMKRSEGLLQKVMEELQQEPKAAQAVWPEHMGDTEPHN